MSSLGLGKRTEFWVPIIAFASESSRTFDREFFSNRPIASGSLGEVVAGAQYNALGRCRINSPQLSPNFILQIMKHYYSVDIGVFSIFARIFGIPSDPLFGVVCQLPAVPV